MVSQRIIDFITTRQPASPCLIMDIDIVRENYRNFRQAMPQSQIYYAVKSNPSVEVLRLLCSLGSSFDTASINEIEMVLDAGARPENISFGNTIKKETDIARAFDLGVTLFAVDSVEEAEKVARAAPGSSVFCRILTDGRGAEWPLSRKFGCAPTMALNVIRRSYQLGLRATGVSFHVGSQQTDLAAWDRAIADSALLFRQLEEEGIPLTLLNMGGGFPTQYAKEVPPLTDYGRAINASLHKHFADNVPTTIIEPGRAMVGNAGILKAEVVLIAKKDSEETTRWVYLDVGRFNGLPETLDEAIRYQIITKRDSDIRTPCILAGPTCDSADVMYERDPYPLPKSLVVGDEVLILATGAYTATYASVAFNGFEPIKTYVIS